MSSSLLRYPSSVYISECTFETTRSSGKGGQHVNKTESRVTLVFDLDNTLLFDGYEKLRIQKSAKHHFHSGVVRVSADQSRSQLQNKKQAIVLFLQLLEKWLFIKPKRIKTKLPASKKAERTKTKKILSEKKASRKKPRRDEI